MNKKTILLTIDTEFYFSLEEIFGINGENGIEDILNIFDEHNVKATFFIDYLSIGKWGEKPFIKLTKLLKKSGHDIQLHAHSDSFGGKPYFWQLSYDKQKFVIEKAIHYFEKFNSETPKFFRAGSYSANNDTLEILKEKGFTADLSFQYKQKRCKITVEKFQFANKVGLIDNLLEIPTGVYKYYYPFPRYNSINLEWCSLSELKEICKQFEKSNADHFVLMLHSFSLLKRKDRSRFSRSSVNKKRLEKFLRFATQNGFRFQTVTEYYKTSVKNKENELRDFLPVLKNPLVVLQGLFIRVKNRCILQKKFRRKVIIGSFLTLFLSTFLLYMIFFDYIEPSVKVYKGKSLDITSWNKDNDISTIEYYFIHDKNKDLKGKRNIDKNGVIFRFPFKDNKKYRIKAGIDSLYIPTDMSGSIIDYYNAYQENAKKEYLDKIILYANWLKNNTVDKDSFVVWTHPFVFTKYDLDYDWTGAWAMGNILSALTRVWQITGDSVYFELGKMAVNSFDVKINKGGLLFVDYTGNYWFEEYPTIPKNSVLNGHINGMLGLYDFWRVTDNPEAKRLFEKGLQTVIHNLEFYDSGYWSRYDLKYDYVTDYYYHTVVHIPQLRVLYQITGNQVFEKYANKWESYLSFWKYNCFKVKILIDAFHRRMIYKSFFTHGK